MKTFTRKLCFLMIFLSSIVMSTYAQNHFNVGTGDMSQTRWELYISEATLPNGDSLVAGDEIAIYDGATIVGALVLTVKPAGTNWSSSRLDAFTVFTTGETGYTPGNAPVMKAWDADDSREYYVSGGIPFTVDNTIPTNWDSTLFPNTWAYTGIKLEFDKMSPGNITATGTVTAASGGAPIVGATVTIDYTGYSGITDGSGDYTISNVPAGVFDVTATATGYVTDTTTGVIFNTSPTPIDFSLAAWTPHFDFGGGNPADSIWTLYIQQATINGVNMDPQDEIAIYDIYNNDTTMVGQFALTQVCTSTNKLENDLIAFATLNSGNGWDAGNSYTFKAYDLSVPLEYTYSTATLVAGSGAYTGSTYPGSADAFSFLSIAFVTTPGSIGGTIDVDGALVTATDTSTSATYTATSAEGNYLITDVPVGEYNIISRKLGYENDTTLAQDVTSGHNTEVNITMTLLPKTIKQKILLSAGFQFVSRNIEPAIIDMDSIVRITDNITDTLINIKNTAAELYRKIGAAWINNIGDWDKEEGYLFYMESPGPDTLTITGYIIDQTLVPIYLYTGYQFISYLPTFTLDAQIAYTDILNNMEWAKNSGGATLRKIGGVWINNIGNIGPDEGIQLNMTGIDTLLYRETAPSGPMNLVQTLELQHFIFEGGNAADNTYTIYIETDDFEIGDEIAAFDGDKLVGAMVIESTDPWYNDLNSFMTLNSGAGYLPDNPIILKGWDASEDKEYSINFEFSDPYGGAYMSTVYPGDNNKYSLANVEKIITGITELNSNSVKIYPNPATGFVNIYSPVNIQEVEIYDLLGNKVYSSVFDNEFIRISTENLSHGVYIIRLKYGQNIINKKLTIQ